ncbi:GAF domain-containing sensor histidine kinase [Nodularia harveyana UHCC-0300]|uniref:histidine kinase n=1 Tax=Nodularia harveyana UHCC-0300 TaxID=2974287 RepID=A0ABU5UDP1_9CYAN|nr:GAF domain-containing sensor histidine kinase [Nodularia harveyana]MEA5581632.1 GAF domain-containing sensor histidine kinase [Nodularia harveyana UHCC-0300]
MVEPEKNLLGFQDGWVFEEAKEIQRLEALSELGLRRLETIPVFEEATQTAAHFLEVPISILGFVNQEFHWFKSAVGLSRLGLMNHLAENRQLLREESFCTQVVESSRLLIINDTKKVSSSLIKHITLVKDYGIRAYLGAPLIDAAGNCLGALEVIDLVPRNFTNREIEFLQIIARWCMSEFERNRMLRSKNLATTSYNPAAKPVNDQQTSGVRATRSTLATECDSTKRLQLQLLGHITQELRTPLTSVLGMAGMLGREIYGPLTIKQREYLEIIQNSGRYLLFLVNEITELGTLDKEWSVLNLSPVNIEMLCQQVINTVQEAANRREQNIHLSIEPGYERIWLLDKDKVRQILYHLIFSVIQVSATESIVRIHISDYQNQVNITVWVCHPWLGDGITEVDSYFQLNSLSRLELTGEDTYTEKQGESGMEVLVEKRLNLNGSDSDSLMINSAEDEAIARGNLTRERLGLLLSVDLAKFHGGKITIQGSPESGQRYVLSLPLQMATSSENITD